MDGNGCVSECLSDGILVRRLWTVEKDVQGVTSNHQAPRVRVTRSQPGELLKPGWKGLLWRLLERALLPGDLGVFAEHTYKRFLSVLSWV